MKATAQGAVGREERVKPDGRVERGGPAAADERLGGSVLRVPEGNVALPKTVDGVGGGGFVRGGTGQAGVVEAGEEGDQQ